jgi:hypothetical protein
MSKVSSNAGKHPYLRTDEEEYRNLFSHLKFDYGGVHISKIKKPFFNVTAETEYIDKDGQQISFKDILKFRKREYVVDFRDQKWIMIDIKDPKKVEILKEKALQTVLIKKHN